MFTFHVNLIYSEDLIFVSAFTPGKGSILTMELSQYWNGIALTVTTGAHDPFLEDVFVVTICYDWHRIKICDQMFVEKIEEVTVR